VCKAFQRKVRALLHHAAAAMQWALLEKNQGSALRSLQTDTYCHLVARDGPR
jgi:hypothetical protein